VRFRAKFEGCRIVADIQNLLTKLASAAAFAQSPAVTQSHQ
jgi:hypothetical protein